MRVRLRDMKRNSVLNPEIHLIGDCHTCGEPILYGRETCPHCGITIDHDELVISALNKSLITQAISSANTILSSDAGIYVFLIMTVLRAVIGYPRWFDIATSIPWTFPMITILFWFRRHGRWDSNDAEYQEKRIQLKSSLRIWAIANVVNALVVAVTVPMKLD